MIILFFVTTPKEEKVAYNNYIFSIVLLAERFSICNYLVLDLLSVAL